MLPINGQQKVLIIDDEANIRSLVVEVLKGMADHKILEATGARDGVALAQKERPTLVFLDIVMPDGNGWEVCKALKSNGGASDMKVIMMSGLRQDSHKRKAWEMGADYFLEKPFSVKAVMSAVDEVLARE